MKFPALRFLPLLVALAIPLTSTVSGQEAPTRDRSSKEAAGGAATLKGALKPIPKSVSKNASKKPASVKHSPKKAAAVAPPGILILVEWIEVEHEDFSDWVFENRLKTDATELRKEVQRWTKEDDAELIRTVVVHAQSGQRAQVESITEFMYPTEYDPAEIPNEGNLSDNTELPVTPPNGTAFETRNLGTTVEVDPVLSEDGQLIDLNLSPEIVFHLEDRELITKTNDETQIVTLPTMYTAKATTQVKLRNGGYALIGTLMLPGDDDDDDDDDDEEIVLLFVRADAE